MAARFVAKKVRSKDSQRDWLGVHDTALDRVALFRLRDDDDLSDVIERMEEGELPWCWTPAKQVELKDL